MAIPASASLLCLLLCGMLLAPSVSWAQTPANPPTGTLQLPPKKPAPAPPPTPVKTAPREPVHQVAGKSPPVVQPHGAPHALKPPAKPPAAAAAVTPPTPPPVPVEPPKQAEGDTTKGSASGLPLPRFVALRSDDVNLRAGPGTRYPIEWVYKRRELPVEILREFEVWRLVQDSDGIKGWVHQATLTGRRSFIVNSGDITLRHDAEDSATAVAILKSGVIGHIRSCQASSDWCQVQVSDYRGFLKRSQFWGALPNETVANN